MQHVGVREDQVRRLPDLPPSLRLGVAVVDRRPDAREAEPGDAPRLILGQRLRRVEVERTCGRLADDRVEHGQVERERLARRGPRRDEDVLAARGRLPRLALMGVEAVDADARERRRDARVEARREAPRAGLRAQARSSGRRPRHRRGGRPRGASLAEVLRERPLVAALALRPDQRLSRLTADEEDHRRNGEDAVAGRRSEVGVDVELDEPCSAGRLPRRSRSGRARSPCTACTTGRRTRRSPGPRSRGRPRRTSRR